MKIMFFILIFTGGVINNGIMEIGGIQLYQSTTVSEPEAFNVTDNGGEAYSVTDNGGEDYNVQ